MNNQQPLPTEALKNQYIERRREELGTYMQALKGRDFEMMSHIGHRMRGNGVSFGFPELSILGEKIETAAKKQEISELRFLSIDFTNWIDTHAPKEVSK